MIYVFVARDLWGEEEDEEDEAEAFLRQRVLDMLLRRAGCPQERREQLTQGGEPWTQLARSEWWDRVSAAGFFLHDRDPSMSGGSWHDVGDGLSWVDAWGCASAHRLAWVQVSRIFYRNLGGPDFRPKFFESWAAQRARTKGAYFRESFVFRQRSADPGSTDP